MSSTTSERTKCVCGKRKYREADRCRECYSQSRESVHDTCACGRRKYRTSLTCKKCYNAAQGEVGTEKYTECPSCGGKMRVGRYVCTACVTNERVGVKRSGRPDRIEAFVASGRMSDIDRSTIIYCYYWRQRRMNILAKSRDQAVRHVRSFYAGDGSEVIQSVCRICDINLNLTDIDLSDINGAMP